MAIGDLSPEQTAQMQHFKSQFDELDNLADEMDEDIYNLLDLLDIIGDLLGGIVTVSKTLSKTGGGGRKSSFLQRNIYNPMSRGLRNAKVMANTNFTRSKNNLVSAYNSLGPNISSLGQRIKTNRVSNYFNRYFDKDKNKEWSKTIKGDRQLRRKDNIVVEIRIAQTQLRDALSKYDGAIEELKKLPNLQGSKLYDIEDDIAFFDKVINGNTNLSSLEFENRLKLLANKVIGQRNFVKNYKAKIQDLKPLRELCRRFRNLYSAYDKASGDHAIVAATKYVDKYGRKLLGYTKPGSTQPLAIMPAAAATQPAATTAEAPVKPVKPVKTVEPPVKPVKTPITRTMPPMPSRPAPKPPMDINQRRRPSLKQFDSEYELIPPIDATSRDSMPVGPPPPVPTVDSASVESELPEAVPAETKIPQTVADLNIPETAHKDTKGRFLAEDRDGVRYVNGTDIPFNLYKELLNKPTSVGGRRRTHKRKQFRRKSSYRRLRRR
jgi:hypothetical protein